MKEIERDRKIDKSISFQNIDEKKAFRYNGYEKIIFRRTSWQEKSKDEQSS